MRTAAVAATPGAVAGPPAEAMSMVLHGPPLDPRIVELTGATLVELLERAVSRTPDRVALVLRHGLVDERWTYRELQTRSRCASATLAALDIGVGDRVVTWAPNDPWMVAVFFALWRLGAICVPLDMRMREDVAVRIAQRTQPRLVVAAPGSAVESAAALGAPVAELGPGLGGPEEASRYERSMPLPTVTPQMPAEIVFTSGTTSDPKGVVLTHGQVIHSARVIAQTGMGPRPERVLSVIPLSHMYGQIVPLFLSLISGSTLVFQYALSPSALSATLQRERITALTAVPQLLQMVFANIELAAARRGSLGRMERTRNVARHLPMPVRRLLFHRVHRALGGKLEIITSGGVYLSPKLQQAWEDIGVLVVQGYGGTECAAISGHTRTSRRPGSGGMPLAGLDVRIASDGELLVRGPSVMSGYWHAPEATEEVVSADGWFHTGDAAQIDDGEILLLGRTRDRIALPNGLKVYPEDVESALCATEIIRAAVVLEAPVGRVVAVVLPSDAAITDEAIEVAVTDANGSLGLHQRVRQWRRWPETELPRTHTLKVRREAVKSWYREAAGVLKDGPSPGAGVSGAPGAPRVLPTDTAVNATAETCEPSRLVAEVCRLVAEVASVPGQRPPAVNAETTLDSLDIDSLRRVQLALSLEEALAVRLADEELEMVTDVASLVECIETSSGRTVGSPTDGWAFSRPAVHLRAALDATVTGAFLHIVGRPKAEGLQHLARIDGPVLICPNHTSHLDAPVVRHLLPPSRRRRTAVAAAADYFFTRRLPGAAVAVTMGAFAFGRSRDVRESLERVVDLLAQGWSVIIFPEGTRSADGGLGPMREGIGLLATSVRVPVVPVYISGTHELLPKGQALPRRRRESHVKVRFGPPIGSLEGRSAQEATRLVGEAIAALAGPS